jgi:hypothetical protein
VKTKPCINYSKNSYALGNQSNAYFNHEIDYVTEQWVEGQHFESSIITMTMMDPEPLATSKAGIVTLT